MPQRYRSKRARRAALIQQWREQGWTWAQVAQQVATDERVTMRVAFRLAHGWTQAEVAQLWNQRWPGRHDRSGLSDKNISYWETWPQSGYEPSLKTLRRLAQLYQCDVGDLIDDGKYRHFDQAAQPHRTVSASSVCPASPALPGRAMPPGTSDAGDDMAALALMFNGDHHAYEGSPASLQRLLRLAGGQRGSPLQREEFYERLMRLLAQWASTMKRRELLRIFGWAATAAAASPVVPGLDADEQERLVRVLDGHCRIDEPVIGHIESVLWSAMRQDDALGPRAALDTVLAQRHLVRAVLPECPAGLRPRLLSLFANLSRFAGWLSFDLNDFGSAAYYYEQARTTAHEAENTELGVFVLCNMSHLATWRGQPRVGIDHALAAQGWATQTGDALLRAYVADVAARAYATAGMTRQCQAALSGIPNSLDAKAETPATSLAYFYRLGEYVSTRAQCLLLLHDAVGAIQAAQEAVTLIEHSFARNQAFGTLNLGNAYIESGEAEQAAFVIGEGAGLVARNRSARMVGLLMQSRARLERWRHTSAVAALDERLESYGWRRNSTT